MRTSTWQASRLADAGRLPEAVSAYQEVVKADGSVAAAWDRLAELLIESRRLKEASDALASLLRLYPEETRVAAADARLAAPTMPSGPLDRAVLAAAVWTALGEKTKAADVRNAARKSVGDAAMRKAEAAFRK